jgi:hypothetical protein
MRWLLYSDYHLFLFQDQNLMPSIHFTYDKYVYQKLTILIISYMSDTIENVLILQGGGSLVPLVAESSRPLLAII